MGKRSPQHRRSSAAIENWPVPGCCASPGTARTWRTTLQASCSDSVRLGVYSDTVRVAFRRYQAGSTGSKGVKGHWTGHLGPDGSSSTLTAAMNTSKQPFLQSDTRTGTSDTRSRALVRAAHRLRRRPGHRRRGYGVPARVRRGAVRRRRQQHPRARRRAEGGGSMNIVRATAIGMDAARRRAKS